MRINISALNRYLECPRKWYYEYILGRGRASRSQALLDGILWHEVVSGEGELPEDAPPWMKPAFEAWLEWREKHSDIVILATELPLEAPLGPHTLFGRLDALVTWEGKVWHLQHKTMAKSRPLDVLVRTQKRSFHEHAYKHLVEYNKPVRVPERVDGVYPAAPYGGTILVVCKKITTALPIHVEYLTINGGHEEAMVRVKWSMLLAGCGLPLVVSPSKTATPALAPTSTPSAGPSMRVMASDPLKPTMRSTPLKDTRHELATHHHLQLRLR